MMMIIILIQQYIRQYTNKQYKKKQGIRFGKYADRHFRSLGFMCFRTIKMSSRSGRLTILSIGSSMNMWSVQGSFPPFRVQNLNPQSCSHSRSSCFLLAKSAEVREQADHSHITIKLGDLPMVSLMPSKHSTSILSASISAKSIAVCSGRTLSTLSKSTSSALQGYALFMAYFPSQIVAPPVFDWLTMMDPLLFWLLAPTLYTDAIFARLFRCIFFRTMLQDTLQGSSMQSRPFQPAIFPKTTAQRPIWEPMFRIASPSLTNLAIVLSLLGSQVPLLRMELETEPSLQSIITSTSQQMVETSCYREDTRMDCPLRQSLGSLGQFRGTDDPKARRTSRIAAASICSYHKLKFIYVITIQGNSLRFNQDYTPI